MSAENGHADGPEDSKTDRIAAACDPLLLVPGHKLSKLIKEGSVSSGPAAHLCGARQFASRPPVELTS